MIFLTFELFMLMKQCIYMLYVHSYECKIFDYYLSMYLFQNITILYTYIYVEHEFFARRN